MQVRDALRTTATRAATPDNDYGWGIVQAWDASNAPVGVPAGEPIAAGARLLVSPNPSTNMCVIRYALSGPSAPAVVEIFDASGRAVRTLVAERTPSGVGAVEWDGRDEAGRLSPTGVYFARLETTSGAVSSRIVRVR
jgi:hypothetical protein